MSASTLCAPQDCSASSVAPAYGVTFRRFQRPQDAPNSISSPVLFQKILRLFRLINHMLETSSGSRSSNTFSSLRAMLERATHLCKSGCNDVVTIRLQCTRMRILRSGGSKTQRLTVAEQHTFIRTDLKRKSSSARMFGKPVSGSVNALSCSPASTTRYAGKSATCKA